MSSQTVGWSFNSKLRRSYPHTERAYKQFKDSGMMHEIWPEATGVWKKDREIFRQ